MTKTTNYQLNQWDAADPIRREDFNVDNAAIDAALAAKAEKTALAAAEKALADYRTSNDAAVAKKAEQAALNALQDSVLSANSTVAALSAALGSGGENCRIAAGSYVGTGTWGASNPNTLTFDFTPIMVWVVTGAHSDSTSGPSYSGMLLVRAVGGAASIGYSTVDVTWAEQSVQWSAYSNSDSTGTPGEQFNKKDVTYYWVAFGVSG